MEVFADGKAVISSITIDEIAAVGASYDQVNTCIDRIRLVEGTEIAVFLKEKEKNVFRVSFRAKTYADVNRLAVAVGGGGHIKASGATLKMPLNEAIELLKNETVKELDRFK